MNKIISFIKKVKRFLKSIRFKNQKFNIPFLIKSILISGAWVTTFFFAYLLYIFHDLPSVDTLEKIERKNKVTMLDSKGDVLAVYGDMYGTYVNYYEIPRNLINAVVATEDRKFFDHFGIDVLGIFRAAFVNFRAGRTVQGGSTITQQLAKIVFLSSERKFSRKLKEALLALEIENKYSKQEIITIYLNKAYMGSGIFGVSAAAKYYFAKNVQDLNLYESAIIAGLLKSPSRFSPKNNKDLSGNRAYQILLNMEEAGFINSKQLKEAENVSVILDTKLLGSVRKDYFTNWVYDQISQYINPEEVRNFLVKTTFNTQIQAIAKREFKKQLSIAQEKRNTRQGAVLIMDYNGNIVSMIGGDNFFQSNFNRAAQAFRQSGSLFKTFVFAAAMESGFNPQDIIEDRPINYRGWTPQNFDRRFYGKITLEESFRRSLNTVPIRLMAKVGVSTVIQTAKKMGIKSEIDYNLAAALGTSSNNLIELTAAHGVIGNGGYAMNPHAIECITNSDTDQILYKEPEITPERVLTEKAAEDMQLLLRSAVVDGSARRALSSFKVSGKTGTSQDFRDAWFIGYTNKYIIGVWFGNDDYSPTKNVTGGTFPTMVARDIFRELEKRNL